MSVLTGSAWSQLGIALGLGVLGAGMMSFSANAASNSGSGQIATGSAVVSGCTGSADVTWTSDPVYLANDEMGIDGGTLSLTGNCVIPNGASTVVAQDSAGTLLGTAQVPTAGSTQTFNFGSAVSTTDIENVTVTVRSL